MIKARCIQPIDNLFCPSNVPREIKYPRLPRHLYVLCRTILFPPERRHELFRHCHFAGRRFFLDPLDKRSPIDEASFRVHQRIIVITGSPGTGKTTTASIVAKESDMDKSVHMHTDDFFHYLSKGAIPPHLPESNKQNLVVIEAFLEAAKRYARGGYDVIVDGIVGPWFLEPWKALAQEDYEVHYIVLRASKKETMKRAVERSKLDRKTNIELVETMWEQFSGLGIYESNVIDTTTFTIKDTVSAIKERVACGTSLLS